MLPKDDISTQDIKGTFNLTSGKVNFILDDAIIINEPIFLSFEWLASKNDAIKIYNINNMINTQILINYKSTICDNCSRIIENNKAVSFYNSKGKFVERIKFNKKDRKEIKKLNKLIPRLAFQTTKVNVPTYYKYATFGKWYEYEQSLISSIEIYNN